jgi:hypothetical protein
MAPYWSMLISSWHKVCKLYFLAGGTPSGSCTWPMLSQPKSSAQAGRQVIYKSKGGTSMGIGNLNSAFEKADRLLEQNLLNFTQLRH